MHHVDSASTIANLPHLVLNNWKPHKDIDLYNEVKCLFILGAITQELKFFKSV